MAREAEKVLGDGTIPNTLGPVDRFLIAVAIDRRKQKHTLPGSASIWAGGDA